ncbi:hypothetical protein RvY_19307-1 [Ramazzottius varieornatus]|uniref:Uncharacterized protein n=1 Tax=Ramazzottius varieornatus TaxID=947166 RepID=A0A1D1W8Z5_RAMVA|nr:hypothetical protein RvY_19307-1 [Ramazzottius varieornatus]
MEKSGSAWAVYFYADKPPKLGVVQPSWCVQGDGPDTPTVGSNCMVKWQGRGKPFPAIFLDQEIGKTVKEAYKSLEGKLKDAATDEALTSMGKSYAAAELQPSNVQSDTAVNLPDNSITTVISHPHGHFINFFTSLLILVFRYDRYVL